MLSILAVVPAFALTGVIVGKHRGRQQELAVTWARTAEQRLAAGQPLEAAEAYRTALSYDRENPSYQLRLARALIAAGRLPEARAYLRTLVNADPSHGAVNLELARLAARGEEQLSAVQHFHRAIDGYWAGDAADRRREARVELASYLLSRGDYDAAVAELMALAAELPADASQHAAAGRRLADAGAHSQALNVFRRALEIDPDYAPAMLGAGRAAFALGDYGAARRYLARYERAAGRGDEDGADLLAILDHVAQLDARAPRLTIAQRAARAARAFALASNRLECVPRRGEGSGEAPSAPAAAAVPYGWMADAGMGLHKRMTDTKPRARADSLRRNPDEIDQVFELALEASRTAAARCGEPAGADLALLALARLPQTDDDARR